MKPEVTLSDMEERRFYGLWTSSNDKTVAKDIPSLSARFYQACEKQEGTVLPFVVLSRSYEEKTGNFELFVGGLEPCGALEEATVPAGTYAKMTVRPKLGFLWGPAIGQAKTYLYRNWIAENGFCARNLEYEYHTEESKGKSPSISLFFAVKKQEER